MEGFLFINCHVILSFPSTPANATASCPVSNPPNAAPSFDIQPSRRQIVSLVCLVLQQQRKFPLVLITPPRDTVVFNSRLFCGWNTIHVYSGTSNSITLLF